MAKSIARGKALVAKFRATPGVRDPEALAAYAGRVKKYRKAGKSAKEAMRLASKAENVTKVGKAAGKAGGGGGGNKPPGGSVPNPSERFGELPDDVTEKQGNYLRSLLDKATPDTYPNSETGEPQMLGPSKLAEYAIIVNMPLPKSRQEASKMIDGLKNGNARNYARDNQDWFQSVAGKLAKKYGNDLSGIKTAAAKRYNALPTKDKIRLQDSRRAYLREIINPLLKV